MLQDSTRFYFLPLLWIFYSPCPLRKYQKIQVGFLFLIFIFYFLFFSFYLYFSYIIVILHFTLYIYIYIYILLHNSFTHSLIHSCNSF